MEVLDKLELELANVEYFSLEEYEQVLNQYGLSCHESYRKSMEKNIYLAALEILRKASENVESILEKQNHYTSKEDVDVVLKRRMNRIQRRLVMC